MPQGISIIIPTLNPGEALKTLLVTLRAQTVEAEVIVVDSSSDDGTADTARALGAKVMVIPRENFDHGGTRSSVGLEAAGDIIVYLTQDALPADEFAIEKLTRPLSENPTIGLSFGKQLPHRDSNPFAVHLRLFNYPSKSYKRRLEDVREFGLKTAFLSNSFAAYRRSALEEIGWFKKGLIFGEDTCAGAKMLLAGYKISYVSDALVYHSHNYTLGEEFRRYFDIGVFHEVEKWILDNFGKAEGEGIRFVRSGVDFLIRKRKFHLLPEFAIRNGLKYLGYMLGRNYKSLPLAICSRLSMHSNWWYKPRKSS